MQKFGEYNFSVIKDKKDQGFYYEIYTKDFSVLRQAKETFQYEGIARFAAIGHISLLEQGKG
jgi:hypothetical protein